MDELLARAMQGVDQDDPGAFLQIFMNLMGLVPWGQLIFWQIVFVLVGGLLGWWRGRTKAGVIASLVLGPLGWIVPFLPRRTPPPLPGRSPMSAVPPTSPTSPPASPSGSLPPPLPGSKKR